MKLPDFAVETVSMIAGAKVASDAGDPDAGQAVADFVKCNLYNFVSRFSHQRQAKRVINVTEIALNGIRRRLKNGEKLRNDGFFEREVDRAYAAEALETVLLKSRDEPEEKKIPYLAKLFEETCFNSKIDSDTLHFLCKEFESLTYRQLCIIKMVNEKKYILREKSIQEDPQFKTAPNVYTIPADKHPILTELVVLCNREYIVGRVSDVPATTLDTMHLLRLNTIGPAGAGVLMYAYMKLESIPETDVMPIVEALS